MITSNSLDQGSKVLNSSSSECSQEHSLVVSGVEFSPSFLKVWLCPGGCVWLAALTVSAADPHQPATPSDSVPTPIPPSPAIPTFLLVLHLGCTDQRGACLPRSPPPRTTRQIPPPLPPRPEWVPTIHILTHGRPPTTTHHIAYSTSICSHGHADAVLLFSAMLHCHNTHILAFISLFFVQSDTQNSLHSKIVNISCLLLIPWEGGIIIGSYRLSVHSPYLLLVHVLSDLIRPVTFLLAAAVEIQICEWHLRSKKVLSCFTVWQCGCFKALQSSWFSSRFQSFLLLFICSLQGCRLTPYPGVCMVVLLLSWASAQRADHAERINTCCRQTD